MTMARLKESGPAAGLPRQVLLTRRAGMPGNRARTRQLARRLRRPAARNLGSSAVILRLTPYVEEAKYVAERWRLDYNHHRPHRSLNWMTPAALAALCPSAVDGHGCVPWKLTGRVML